MLKITTMLTVSVEDGLGNQLFRLASLYSYSKDTGRKAVVKHSVPYPHRRNYWQSIFHQIPNYATEQHQWDRIPDQQLPCAFSAPYIHLTGYFQDPRHFDHNREDILSLFTLPDDQAKAVNEKWSELVPSDKIPICLHVRRGDYLAASHVLTNLSLQYYREALAQIELQVTGDKQYVVFSDDIAWCQEHLPRTFPEYNFTFVTGTDEVTDLFLMSKAKGYILANSSFSWFGWYLNPLARQVPVIAPRKWFVHQSPTILHPHFTVLDVV